MDEKLNAQYLRSLAAKYQQAARKLNEAADIIERMRNQLYHGAGAVSDTSTLPEKATRKGQMINLLREKGPLSRKEILASLPGVPLGTISYILQNPEFERGDDRKWRLKTTTHHEDRGDVEF